MLFIAQTKLELGVFLDQTLSFEFHIKEVTRMAIFHLRNIAKRRPILSFKNAEVLTHAFIISRLDYCNAWTILSGLAMKNIQGLSKESRLLICPSLFIQF